MGRLCTPIFLFLSVLTSCPLCFPTLGYFCSLCTWWCLGASCWGFSCLLSWLGEEIRPLKLQLTPDLSRTLNTKLRVYSQTTASPWSGNLSDIAGMVHGHIFPSCGKNYLIFLFTSLLPPMAQKWLWLQVSTMRFVKTRKCYVRIPEPTLCLSIAYAIALRVAHLASQRLLPVQNIYRVLKMCIVCSIQKRY